MLIQTNTNIALSAWDLILVHTLRLRIEAWEKMSLFLELRWGDLCMLVIRERYNQFFWTLRFLKYETFFFGWIFFILWAWAAKCRVAFLLRGCYKSFLFKGYKKSVLLTGSKNILNITAIKFHFQKYKGVFRRWIFFLMFELGLGSTPGHSKN